MIKDPFFYVRRYNIYIAIYTKDLFDESNVLDLASIHTSMQYVCRYKHVGEDVFSSRTN